MGRRTAFIFAAALCVPLLPFIVVGELPGERWLSMNDGHAWQFAAVGAALLAADVVLPLPSSLVGTMLGARLGLAAGFAAAFAGLMAGQLAAFALARRVGAGRSAELPQAPALAVLFLSRPVPVLAEAVVIAAGAARLDWPRFLLGCTAGNAVYAAALALNGSQLVPGAPIGPGLLLPMLLPPAAWLVWRKVRSTNDRGG